MEEGALEGAAGTSCDLSSPTPPRARPTRDNLPILSRFRGEPPLVPSSAKWIEAEAQMQQVILEHLVVYLLFFKRFAGIRKSHFRCVFIGGAYRICIIVAVLHC